jgi:hypothetical protein
MADAEVSQPSSITSEASDTDMAQRANNGSNESNTSSDVDIPVENSTPDVTELEIAEKLPAADDTDANIPQTLSAAEIPQPAIQVTLPTPASQPSSAQPAPVANSNPIIPSTTQAASLPKARLPHDTTGILEDRIKEDPRGDLDAWLALINEHRKRNKLDDARAVYDRFFKVFPQAVGPLNSLHLSLLTFRRPKYGYSGLIWSSRTTTLLALNMSSVHLCCPFSASNSGLST